MTAQVGFESRNLLLNPVFVVVHPLHNQHALGVAFHKKAVLTLGDVLLGKVEYLLVHQFNRRRRVFQRNKVSLENLVQGCRVNAHQGLVCRWLIDKVQLYLGDERQSSFRTGNELAEVEFLVGIAKNLVVEKAIEGIAGVTAADFGVGIVGFYFIDNLLVGQQVADMAVYVAFKRLKFAFSIKLLARKFSKSNIGTI